MAFDKFYRALFYHRIGKWKFLVALLSKRKKNACIVESTDYESQIGGFKGLIKKC